MKEIELTQGYKAQVDDEDYDKLNQYKWSPLKGKLNKTHYATAAKDDARISMHRLIMNCTIGDEIEVDHIDLNGLNNQKSNLRICTHSQNGCNKGLQSNNVSGYKGVSWCKRDKVWRAFIKINNRATNLGSFDSALDAAVAYDIASKSIHKEFRRNNGLEDENKIVKRIKPEPKGYYLNKRSNKWQASIRINKENVYLGEFKTELEARKAYLNAKIPS